MIENRGLVVHIAEGTFEGTIAWCKNPAANVSTHFVTAKDGRIAQMVDTTIAAWTQQAGNGHWLSVENEGFSTGKLTAQQIEANAQLFARGHKEHGWPLQLAGNPNGRGLGYHSMGSNEGPCNWSGANWGHCACPGKNIISQLPLIVARAREIVNGDPVPSLDAADLAAIKNVVWYSTLAASGTPSESAGTIELQLWIEQKRQAQVLNEILALLQAGGGTDLVQHTHDGGQTGPAVQSAQLAGPMTAEGVSSADHQHVPGGVIPS